MLPYFSKVFGNPHSRSHEFGWEAEKAVEKSRQQVADLIGANKKEIVFTSGATEANNIAIKGVANFYKKQKKHIITCITEHKCVLESCRYLERQGFEITYLSVNKEGLIDLQELKNAITENTSLVTIMAANNELVCCNQLQKLEKFVVKKVFFSILMLRKWWVKCQLMSIV